MSEPAVTTTEGRICTHRPQNTSDQSTVAACKILTYDDCKVSALCQPRKTLCLFDKMWIRVKSLKTTSSTWFTTIDNLKGFDYVYTTNEESFTFSGSTYTDFLFMRDMNSSAGNKWSIAPKSSVIPATPSATAAVSVSSSYL